jgi:ureidoglycolate lyase
VSFHPGTWHHPLLAQQHGDFVVLERKAFEVDCEIKSLLEPVEILAR